MSPQRPLSNKAFRDIDKFKALATLSNAALIRRKRSSAYGCTNSGITDSDRKKFLDYHNEARLRVAQGQEPNRDGGYMNGAKNMYKL
ncbi:hypothetical protein OESDEN_13632, partial [Oesophagostomum dentatum]